MTGADGRGATIAALATPPGPGGIAVIRVSGPEAITLVDRLFRGRQTLSRLPGYRIAHGHIVEPGTGAVLDEVLVSVFRRPRSYTGEDMVEVSCHGGRVVSDVILRLLLEHGGRAARPGEFTRRAVLNGRLDLTRAEAVLELVNARSETALRPALAQLDGSLSRTLTLLRAELDAVRTRLAARAELGDDCPRSTQRALATRLAGLHRRVSELVARAGQAPLLRQGALVVIIGRTNVGKSSLFNRLAGSERAIVTPFPGTTRDALEAEVSLGGLAVRLVDTAGWRFRGGRIEALGQARALDLADRADALLLLIDAARPLNRADAHLLRTTAGRRRVLVLNKVDLPRRAELPDLNGTPVVALSARTGRGIARLNRVVGELFPHTAGETDFVASRRQLQGLQQAEAALERARHAPAVDACLAEVELADAALAELIGERTGAEVLDRIFRDFCVGK